MPCKNHRTFWGFVFIANPTTFCVSVKLFPKHPELHVVIHFLTESKVQHVDPYGTNNFITINWSAHQSMSKNEQKQHCFFWEQFVSGSIYPPVLNGKYKLQKWRVLRPGEGKSKNCQSNMKFTNRHNIRFLHHMVTLNSNLYSVLR